MTQDPKDITIINAETAPHHLPQLRQWFLDEWDELDPFEGTHPEIKVPTPLLATNPHGKLTGGLSFTTHPHPNTKQIAIWINALLVAPTHRKKGIATKLIHAAEQKATQSQIPQLLVLTNLPNLYQKQNWTILQHHHEDTILIKRPARPELPPAPSL